MPMLPWKMKYKFRFMLAIHLMILSALNAQKGSVPKLKGAYLGQKPPGMEAVLFAEGIVSTDSIEHSAPAFSPDGRLVLWTKIYKGKPAFLVEMKNEKGRWSQPARPSFASPDADDFYPAFSYDGKKLFFSSRRPLPSGYPKNEDMWIWVVERKWNGWGTPVPLDSNIMKGFEYAHSVSKRGTIFFSSRRPGTRAFDIFSAKWINNKYQEPKLLNDAINTVGYEDGPFIAPDESYLIFESQRAESVEGSIDLFISFKQKDGNWGKPKNMGPRINTKYAERFAMLSPDGKYLFFGSNRRQLTDNLYFDIYWIDARVINELKQD
jgi:Tol biopolymer transport system component